MEIVPDIIYSRIKTNLYCKGGETFKDLLNYGFAYIEQQDCIVNYIVSNNRIMKKIFGEIPDSILKPEKHYIGYLWTAKLLLSDKLFDSQILFSDSAFSVVVNLNLNLKEVEDANI
jgi:hypothetical protein